MNKVQRKKTNPILIIGTQRSGSNLLRLMLNQLPEIEAPHPPHILHTFYPLLAGYGDLANKTNFRLLIRDIVAFISVNPVPWINVEFNEDGIFSRCNERSLIEIFKTIYELKAEQNNSDYWCCKSMSNVYYLSAIEATGMRPVYIHIIRDGRDVAASFKRSLVGEKHIYFIARQWKAEQELAVSMTTRFAAERTYMVLYEELLRDPRAVVEPILDSLNLRWTDNLLNYYLSDEAKNTAAAGAMWQNVAKPIDKNNMRHFSEKLTGEEIALFEQIAGDTLTYFGYKYNHAKAGPKYSFSEQEIQLFSLKNEQLKIEARQLYLKEAEVRLRQEEIVKQIKGRCTA